MTKNQKMYVVVFAVGVATTLLLLLLVDWSVSAKTRILGECKWKASEATVSMPHDTAAPVSSLQNQNYFEKKEELIVACMEARGFRQKQPESAAFAIEAGKAMHDDDLKAIPYNHYDAATLPSLWERRWPWE